MTPSQTTTRPTGDEPPRVNGAHLGVGVALAPSPGVVDAQPPPADHPGPPPRPVRRRFQNLLTVAVALIATAAQAQGMWRFFGDVFRIDNLGLRGALFAFIELAILASALRARRHRIVHGSLGIDGAAVWALAVLSGFLAATDARDWREAAGRFVVPLVAAWMFERAISVERKDAIGGGATINWRLTPERILVWLRLAEAVDRSASEVDRRRRLATLARDAFRLHMLPPSATWRRRRAQARLRRHLLAADEHLSLGTDRVAMHELRASLAVLFQATDGTSPAAVADLSPWQSDPRVARKLPRVSGPDVPSDTGVEVPVGSRPSFRGGSSGRKSHRSGGRNRPEVRARRSAEETRQMAADIRAGRPGMTQAEVAKLLGISDRQLRNVERVNGNTPTPAEGATR